MAKIKFYYNTETCKYERVVTKTSDVVLNAFGFVIASFLCGGLILFAYFRFFDSPKEKLLRSENQQLRQNFELINRELDDIEKRTSMLRERDNNIYRIIFESEPIKVEFSSSGVNNSSINLIKYLDPDFDKEYIIDYTMTKIDKIKSQIIIQNKSYDELAEIASNKEQLLAGIPAIMPISIKKLKMLASGFGMRIHPIYKVRKFHTGVDLAAMRGTPVVATGDGVVNIPHLVSGYGNFIDVNHGYGYVTRYAHLHKYKVRDGQRVKRGEIIGYVGSTGTATAPHLHYEVLYKGEAVNPVYHFFNDLNAKEYEEILKLASVENQSLGGAW
ncbi:MAG: M23 family metallopeptidase [Cytophagales bacterium]|nr:M23 family metallopeptidase [Cytophagales bacterium]